MSKKLLFLGPLVTLFFALIFFAPEYFYSSAADKFMPPEYNKPYFSVLPTAFDQMDYNIMWWVENRVGRITRFQTHDYLLNSIAHAEIAAREKRLHIDFNDHPFFSFIGPSMLGMIPAVENYLHLEEILQMMPTAKNFTNQMVSRSELFDAARLIQFFETARFLESYYTNIPYSSDEITHLYFTNSPRLCSVYDQQHNLIASLDRVENKFSYHGSKLRHGRNFLIYLHRAWNTIIKRAFVVVKHYQDESWGRRTHYQSSPFAGTRFMSNIPIGTFFSKKILARKKYTEMKHFGIFPEKPKMWAAYTFKAWAMLNPYHFKFGNRKFLSKHSLWHNYNPRKFTSQAARALKLNQANLGSTHLHFFRDLVKEASDLVQEFNQNLDIDRTGVRRFQRSTWSPYSHEAGYTLATTLLRDLQGQHFRLRDVSVRDNYGQGFGNLGRKLRNDFQWHRKLTPYEMALFHNWAPSDWWGFPYLSVYHWLIDFYHDARWNDRLYQRPNYVNNHTHFAPARLGDPGEVLLQLINKQRSILNFFVTDKSGIQNVQEIAQSANTKFNKIHQLRLVSNLLESLSKRVELEKMFLDAINSNSPEDLSNAIVDSLDFHLNWLKSPSVKLLTQHLSKQDQNISIEQFLSLPGSDESTTYWKIISGIANKLQNGEVDCARQGIFFLSDFLPAFHSNKTSEWQEDKNVMFILGRFLRTWGWDFFEWPWQQFYPNYLYNALNYKEGVYYDMRTLHDNDLKDHRYEGGERPEPTVLNSVYVGQFSPDGQNQGYKRVALVNYIQDKLFKKIQGDRFSPTWPLKWLDGLDPQESFEGVLPGIYSKSIRTLVEANYWNNWTAQESSIPKRRWEKWYRQMLIFSRPNAPAFNEIQYNFAMQVALQGLKKDDKPRQSILQAYSKMRKCMGVESRVRAGFELAKINENLKNPIIAEESRKWYNHWHYIQNGRYALGMWMNRLLIRLELQWKKWVKTAGHFKYVRGVDSHGNYRLISVPTWYQKFRAIAESLVRDLDPFIRQKPNYLISNKLFLSQKDKWLLKSRKELDLTVANSVNLLRFYKSYLERQGVVFGHDYRVLRNYYHGFRTLVGGGKYSGWSFKIFRLNTMKPYQHYLSRWSLNWRARPHKVYRSQYRRQLSIHYWMKNEKSKHFRDPHQKALVFYYKTKSISCHFPNQWRRLALTPMGFCHFGNTRFEDLLTKISQFQGTWLNSKFVAKVNPWWMRGPGPEGELYRHCHDIYYTNQKFLVPWTEIRGGSMATNFDLLTYFPSNEELPRLRRIFDTFHRHYSDSLDLDPYQFKPYSFLANGRQILTSRGVDSGLRVDYLTYLLEDLFEGKGLERFSDHNYVSTIPETFLTWLVKERLSTTPFNDIHSMPQWDLPLGQTDYLQRLTTHLTQHNAGPNPIRQYLLGHNDWEYPTRFNFNTTEWGLLYEYVPFSIEAKWRMDIHPITKMVRDHLRMKMLTAAELLLKDHEVNSVDSVRWRVFQHITQEGKSSLNDWLPALVDNHNHSTFAVETLTPVIKDQLVKNRHNHSAMGITPHYTNIKPDRVWPESWAIKYWKDRPLWEMCDWWQFEEEHRNDMFPFIDKRPETQQREYLKILWKGPRERRYYPAEPYYFLNNMDWREIERILADNPTQSWFSKKVILDSLYLEKLRYYYFLKVVAAANPPKEIKPPITTLHTPVSTLISLKDLVYKYQKEMLPNKTPKDWFGVEISWNDFNKMSGEEVLNHFIQNRVQSRLGDHSETFKNLKMPWSQYLTLLKHRFTLRRHFDDMQKALYQKLLPFTALNGDQDYCEKVWGSRADGLFYRFFPLKAVRQEWAKRTFANPKALDLYVNSDLYSLIEKFGADRSKMIKYLFINEVRYGGEIAQDVLPSSIDNLGDSLVEVLNLTEVGKRLAATLDSIPSKELSKFHILKIHCSLLSIHEASSPKWIVNLLTTLAPELPAHFSSKSRWKHLWSLAFLKEHKDLDVVEDLWEKDIISDLKLIVETQDKASVATYNHIHSIMQYLPIHKNHRVIRQKKEILRDMTFPESDPLDWLTQDFYNDSSEDLLIKKYFQETFGYLGETINRNPMKEVPAYFDNKVKDVVHWEYDFSLWLLQDKLQETSLWPVLEDTWDFSLMRNARTNLDPTGWYDYCNTFIGSNPKLIDINQILSTLGPLPEVNTRSRQVSAWRVLWFRQLLLKSLVPESFKKVASYSKIIKE